MKSEACNCIFCGLVDGCVVLLDFYIDDGLIAAKSHNVLNGVLDFLKKSFQITFKYASVFAGFQIERDRNQRSMLILHESSP